MKAIFFTIRDKKFGIEIQFVSAIELRHSIVSIPNAPGGIRGIVDLRGNICPVYNLAKRFGYEYDQKNDGDSPLLLCEIGNELVALEVDDVEEICEIDTWQFCTKETVGDVVRAFIKNVITKDEKTIMMVDVEKIISEEDKKKLNEIEQW